MKLSIGIEIREEHGRQLTRIQNTVNGEHANDQTATSTKTLLLVREYEKHPSLVFHTH